MSTRMAVLRLYREILKSSAQFEDYNFRQYSIRSAKTRFRQNRNVSDVAAIAAMVQEAVTQRDLVRRQVLVGRLYAANRVLLDAVQKTPKG